MRTRLPYPLAAAFLLALAGVSAAQPSRTFVASSGSDANAPAGCPRSAPCRGFQAAIGAVAAGGEVVALDTAGYGPMTIDKAVTVTSEAIHAAVTASSGNAITVNAPGAAVTVRNLRLIGAGGQHGVNVTSAARVYLDNLIVSGFVATGVTAATGRLYVSDTAVRNSNAGIVLAGVIGVLERVQMESGSAGLIVSSGSAAFVRDCLATGNTSTGLTAHGDGAVTSVLEVERCLVSRNALGIVSEAVNGATVTVRVAGTRVVGNTTGLDSDGGALVSFGDNKLAGNGTDGAFTATIAKQ